MNGSPHLRHKKLLLGISASWLISLTASSAERPFHIVSVGDSVASGQGSPDVPAVNGVNPDFDPIRNLPNPAFDPVPHIPNPAFDPIPGHLNRSYDPIARIINPAYQPFPIPAFLTALLPNFPPYNPNLTILNPNYSPDLTIPNPSFEPNPLIPNPGLDTELFLTTPNPNYDVRPVAVLAPPEWKSAGDYRSDFAGPALAAARLKALHPERDIEFLHLAKSGDDIDDIAKQVDRALVATGGRIDVLMISAGGNNIGNDGFSGLFDSVLASAESGHLPSQDPAFTQEIEDSFLAMPRLLDQLATHIGDCEVGEVFITEYFDMTRGEDGEFSLSLGNNEMQWVYEDIILPLNSIIEDAATAHGWHYVGGIADQFRNHGYFAGEVTIDLLPELPNPDFDPREEIINLSYNPFQTLPNLNYNPVRNLPNLNYNPIASKPNINYDPLRFIPNPNYKLFPPNQDLRLTVANPGYDTRLTVSNPAYDPSLTIENPAYDPNLTISNPAYDPNLTIPNASYDPALVRPNPAYEAAITEGENWVVRVEESLLLQSDHYGTAHPNRQGQEVYGNRLLEEILAVGLENIFGCPEIQHVAMESGRLHFTISSKHAAETLTVQSSEGLINSEWIDEPADIIEREDGSMVVWLDLDDEPKKFFRLVFPD